MTSSLKKLSLLFSRSTRALSHKDYKIFFYGQLCSLIGNWITNIATSWLVYRLTGSALLLGIVSFASQFPAFIVSPFAGVHVDRLEKKRVLIVTQALAAVQSLALAVLTLSNLITIPLLVTLGIFQAIVDGFYIPARQAFISDIVKDRKDLANAIALNSASFHFARLLGPTIGGLLILSLGEGLCFLIDAVSYIGVLISLFFISSRSLPTIPPNNAITTDLLDGIRYIRAEPLVGTLLSYVYLISFFGIAHTVLLPVLVQNEFSGGPHILGILMGCSGLGAFIGALNLAVRTNIHRLFKSSIGSGLIFGFGVLLVGISPNVTISSLALCACGYAFITVAAGASTLIQTKVSDQYRGRVMSFFAMSFTGLMPLGSMVAGKLSESLGVRNALSISGVLCVLCAIVYLYIVKVNYVGNHVRMD